MATGDDEDVDDVDVVAYDPNDPHGDGLDDDLMGDEDDRARLRAMTELERETMMLERSERRRAIESRRRIMEMAARSKRSVSDQRTGARTALEKLAEERSRRERKRRVFGDDSEEDDAEAAAEYYSDDDARVADARMVTKKPKRGGASEVVVDEDDDFDSSTKNQPATKAEIESITIRRHQLESWISEPFFESAVVGCLTRVGIGLNKHGENVYRLVEISGVAEGKYKQYSLKPYAYVKDKPPTNVWLVLKWGQSEKTFRISEISNSATQDNEWSQWVAHCRDAGCKPITSEDVQKALENLREAQNYRYTTDDVTKILAQKRERLGGVRHNLLFEKEQIRTAIAHAEAEDDFAKAEELRGRLEEIDREVKARLEQRSGSTQDALANINRKNEIQNSEKLSKRASEQVARLKKGLANTGEGDPFSRRPTRLTTYWDMGVKEDGAEGTTKGDEKEQQAATAASTATNAEDDEDHDDIFLTAGQSAGAAEKELRDVLQQAHRETSLAIDLRRLDAPSEADTFREKSTRGILRRGAALLKSSYDAARAAKLAATPTSRAFTVQEYLAEFA